MDEYSRDELDALWVEFLREDSADCPYCGSVVDIEIRDHAGEGEPQEISARCRGCGRSATGPANRLHPWA